MLEQHKSPAIFAEATLSPTQRKAQEHTVAALMVYARWYASVLYAKLRWRDTFEVPTAATDEYSIFTNPDDFYRRKLAHRLFILAHEILHVVLWHCSLGAKFRQQGYVLTKEGMRLPYYPKLMNIAEDLVINAILKACGMEMPPDALYDPALSIKGMESIIEVYALLCKQGENVRVKSADGSVADVYLDVLKPGEGSADLVAKANKAGKGGEEHRRQDMLLAVARATTASKGMGKMPKQLLTLVQGLLEPVIEWPDQLNTLCARRAGGTAFDYRAVDRRLIIRNIGGPQMSEFACGPIVVIVDSSGSIPKRLLDRFGAEAGGALEQLRPSKMYLVICDAEISRVDELEDTDDLMTCMKKGMVGGGGTDFRPPFEWCRDNDVAPDLAIYLTDGHGRFPDAAPPYPVIWAMTTNKNPPWGDVVRIPIDAQ